MQRTGLVVVLVVLVFGLGVWLAQDRHPEPAGIGSGAEQRVDAPDREAPAAAGGARGTEGRAGGERATEHGEAADADAQAGGAGDPTAGSGPAAVSEEGAAAGADPSAVGQVERIGPGAEQPNIDPVAAGTAWVHGVVTGPGGVLLDGVTVQVRSGGGMLRGSAAMVISTEREVEEGDGGERGARAPRPRFPGGEPIASTTTGGDGGYELGPLPPGTCTIRATDEQHADATAVVTLEVDQRERVDLRMAEGAEIRGYVRDAQGAALAGIALSTSWFGGAEGGGIGERNTVSGDGGAFALTGLPIRAQPLRLVARDPSGMFAESQGMAMTGARDVELTMQAAAHVRGEVIDADSGAPVGGAEVMIEASTWAIDTMVMRTASAARAGDDGRFALGPLAPGAYALRVSHPDYATATVEQELREGEEASVTIELGRGAALEGSVTAGGQPLPDAFVFDLTDLGIPDPTGGVALAEQIATQARDPRAKEGGVLRVPGVRFVEADATGSYRLDFLPAGIRWIVAIHADRAALRVDVEIPVGERTVRRDLELPEGGAVRGRVLAVGGAPMAGARVQVLGRYTTTDERGAFELRGVRPGRQVVTWLPTAPVGPGVMIGGGPDARAVSVVAGEVTTIELGPGAGSGAAAIYGVIRGWRPEDGPVGLVPVGQGLSGTRRSEVAADGSYRIEGVPAGSQRLIVGAVHQQVIEVPADADEVRVDIDLPTLTLRGVVLDAAGAPIATAQLEVRPVDAGDDPVLSLFRQRAWSDGEGRFVFERLGARAYVVEVQAAGYQRASRAVSLTAGAVGALQVVLERGGTLTGAVFAPDGTRDRDAALVAYDASGKRYAADGPAMTSGSPDPQLSGLPPGTYTVWALSSRFAPAVRTGVAVGVESVEVELELALGGGLELTCRDEDGAPVEGATAALALDEAGAVPEHPHRTLAGPVTSDAQGRLVLERLRAGLYSGTLRTPDGRSGTMAAEVRAGVVTRAEVTIREP
jgi:protocatechuate 3,4-dioxygenase beta subunit